MRAPHAPDNGPRRQGPGPQQQKADPFAELKIPAGKVHGDTIRELTSDMALLVDSGMPLLRTLRILQNSYKKTDPVLSAVLANMSVHIEHGSTFSEALAQHPKLFNPLYSNMIKAGELGGVLEVILNRMQKLEAAFPGSKKAADQNEQFAWVLGTLTSCGVPILQALNLTKSVSTGKVARAVGAIHESVKEGETLCAPMEASNVFDPILVALVNMGEQTGALPELLIRYAERKTVH